MCIHPLTGSEESKTAFLCFLAQDSDMAFKGVMYHVLY